MPTYLDELRSELASRIGRPPSMPVGLNGWDVTSFSPEYRRNAMASYNQSLSAYRKRLATALPTLQAQVPTGSAPQRIQFVSQDPSTGTLSWNAQGYTDAMFSWMRGQDQYKDWTDTDIRTFLGSTLNKSDQAASAEAWWTGQNIAWRKAGEDAAKDRAGMLAELQAFKAGIGEQYVTQTLTREKGYWEAKIGQTMTQVQQQYAAMGRVASPYLLGELRRRMIGQAADALQARRLELENEVQDQKAKYLTMLNDVLSNTQRTMIDPAQAAQILEALGRGASTVKASA